MKLVVYRDKIIPGEIKISGSKNSSLAIICAAVLSDQEVILKNIPDITDVNTLFSILRNIGYSIDFNNNIARIKQIREIDYRINDDLVMQMRGSYYFMGALLAKLNKVSLCYSGGCNLGKRPINYHLDGFRKMGAIITEENGIIDIKAKLLIPTKIDLAFPSVGATVNLILASTKTIGETIITNCAKEPEIIDLVNFLNLMGAKITGAGTDIIKINGVRHLSTVTYSVMPDRIEAGTYLILGALLNGAIIKGINPLHISSLIEVLTESNYKIDIDNDMIKIYNQADIKPFNVIIGTYPHFPTDLGQPLSVLATQIKGISTIQETIFKNRYSHIDELNKMGAKILLEENIISIDGPTKLTPSSLKAYDLRGAASLVLAASLNNEETIIDNIDVFLRGYEDPISKLASFGINAYFTD